MRFNFKNTYNLPKDSFKTKIRSEALERINFYRFGADDINLNNYFLSNINKSLKQVCKELVMRAVILAESDLNFSVIFEEEDDKLCRLITFGPNSLFGSNILKFIFKNV